LIIDYLPPAPIDKSKILIVKYLVINSVYDLFNIYYPPKYMDKNGSSLHWQTAKYIDLYFSLQCKIYLYIIIGIMELDGK